MRQLGLVVGLLLCSIRVWAAGTFYEGLWRSEDPRIAQRNNLYYSVSWDGSNLKLYRSPSLIYRGIGKLLPANFPLSAPIYIGSLNGVDYNEWVAFGMTVWTCNCDDPYDDPNSWVANPNAAFPPSVQAFDYEVFQNPQPGPYQGRWYLLFVANPPAANYAENIYITEVLSLANAEQNYATPSANANNLILSYSAGKSVWNDVIVEAPAVFVNNSNDLFVVYSGNGTDTTEYAMGIAILARGSDPTNPNNWYNWSFGACGGTNKPAFATGDGVWGPGVARHVKSADGTEDWMMYHSKTFDTYTTPPGSAPDTQQNKNEMYSRYISAQKIAFSQSATCNGLTYTLPSLGTPIGPGTSVNLPSGDPGGVSTYFKIEAESMIPFGYVMGAAVQDLPRVNNNPEVLLATDANCSNGAKAVNFDALATDVGANPRLSGLNWYNAPGGSYLTITTANPNAASFDLYVAGTLVGTMNLPATGSSEIFVTNQFTVDIPTGATVSIVYQQGKNLPADIDFIEMSPTQIAVPPSMTGGTTAAPTPPSATTGTTTGGSSSTTSSSGGTGTVTTTTGTTSGNTSGTTTDTTGTTGTSGTTGSTTGTHSSPTTTGGVTTGSTTVSSSGSYTGPEPSQNSPAFGCSAAGQHSWAFALWALLALQRRRFS